MNRPVEALQQSFLRTKATDLASFMRISELKANSSNNTVFADDKGEIAVLHPQFMPRRDNRFDYTKPVDGSDPATDWRGLHAVSELPNTINPPNGWVFNTQRLALLGGRGSTVAEAARTSRAIWTWPARTTARLHATRLLTGSPAAGASIGSSRGVRQRPAVIRSAGADARIGLAGASGRRSAPGPLARSRSPRCASWDNRWATPRCRNTLANSGATNC